MGFSFSGGNLIDNARDVMRRKREKPLEVPTVQNKDWWQEVDPGNFFGWQPPEEPPAPPPPPAPPSGVPDVETARKNEEARRRAETENKRRKGRASQVYTDQGLPPSASKTLTGD